MEQRTVSTAVMHRRHQRRRRMPQTLAVMQTVRVSSLTLVLLFRQTLVVLISSFRIALSSGDICEYMLHARTDAPRPRRPHPPARAHLRWFSFPACAFHCSDES